MGERLAFQKKNGQKIAGKAYFAGVDKKYPTVIFAHGFGSNYRDLEHHGAGFAESGINCIFFDFCGRSNRPILLSSVDIPWDIL